MSRNIWFTADTHAWHQNIIGYCDRPWDYANDMTEALADNINNNLSSNNDILYHLGDFGWGSKILIEEFRSMINCKHIILVLGNHDKLIRNNKSLQKLFYSVQNLAEINLNKRQKIVLCHYAMRTWNASFHGSWHLYGHSHGTLPEDPNSRSFDVGVDCWDYKPVSLDEIRTKMEMFAKEVE